MKDWEIYETYCEERSLKTSHATSLHEFVAYYKVYTIIENYLEGLRTAGKFDYKTIASILDYLLFHEIITLESTPREIKASIVEPLMFIWVNEMNDFRDRTPLEVDKWAHDNEIDLIYLTNDLANEPVMVIWDKGINKQNTKGNRV